MRTRKSRRGNQILAAAVGAAGVMGLAGMADGAVKTWTGGGGNANWNTAANWNAAFVDGDSAIFAGSTNTSPSNNAYTSVAGITFSANANAFTLGGNSFTLTGDITNNSPNLQTINNAITMSGASRTVAGSGSVTLGAVSVPDGWTLTSKLDSGKVLTFGGTFTKSGSGNYLYLAGTGDTTFSGTFSGQNVHVRNRGTTTVASGSLAGVVILSGGGTVKLDYGTNNVSHIANGDILHLVGDNNGGSVLNYGGVNLVLDGGNHPEVVASTKLGGAGGNYGRGHVNLSRPSGGSSLVMGAISVNAGFTTMNFAENDLASTTTANEANGILNRYATVGGVDWATNSGVAHPTSGNYVRAYTGYSALPTSGGVNTTNYSQNGSATLLGTVAAYTVKLAGNGTLNLGSNNLNVDAGLLYAGTTGQTYTISGTTGYVFTASDYTTGAIHVNGGELVFDCGWGGTKSRVLTKAGQGQLTLQKASSATGAIAITEGALRLKHNTAAGTTGGGINVAVSAAGSALELDKDTSGNAISIGAEALTMNGNGISNGGALRNISGNNTYGGAITIQYQGARINSDLDTLTLTGGITTGNTNMTGDVTFGGAGNITVSTTKITGAGNVIKDGAGTTTLSANNDYTGTTTVTNGTLLVTGTQTGAGAYTVSGTGKLGGNGSIGAAGVTIAAGGKLAPGTSPGAMTMNLGSGSLDISGAVTADNSQALEFELGALAGPNDKVVLGASSTLNIGNNVLNFDDFKFTDVGSAIQAGQYMLFDTSAAIVGLLGSTLSGDLGGGKTGTLAISGQDLVLNVVVPEPTSLGLLGLAGVGTLARRRRRN